MKADRVILLLLASALLACPHGVIVAGNGGGGDVTVTYLDRTYAIGDAVYSGMRRLPARYVQVDFDLDGAHQRVNTDANGSFHIPRTTSSTAVVHITARAAIGPHSVFVGPAVVHDEPVNLQATPGSIDLSDDESAAFNLIDQGVNAIEYLRSIDGAHVDGAASPMGIVFAWPTSDPDLVAYYDKNLHLMKVAAGAEYEDDLVLHELGHWAQNTFARSDSPGGDHIYTSLVDPRLAFSEGFATYFSSAVRRASASPSNRSGLSTHVHIFNVGGQGYADIEDATVHPLGGGVTPSPGTQANELAVAAALWDLVDGASGAEPFDSLDGLDREIWAALMAVPMSEKLAFEAWFRRFDASHHAEASTAAGTCSVPFNVDGAFEAVGIRFYPDCQRRWSPDFAIFLPQVEPNDDFAHAWHFGAFAQNWETVGAPPLQFTLFATDGDHRGDVDWFSFGSDECFPIGGQASVDISTHRVNPNGWGDELDDVGDTMVDVYQVGYDSAHDKDFLGARLTPATVDQVGGETFSVIIQDNGYFDASPTCWNPQFAVRVTRSDANMTDYFFGYYELTVAVR